MGKEFKKLNLNRENIIPSINKFCGIYFKNYTVDDRFEEKGPIRRRLKILADDRDFHIDFHFNTSDGTTTIEVNGADKVGLKGELAKYIKDNCLLGNNCDNKWFVVNNIDKSDFESILDIIGESDYYKETIRSEQLQGSFIYQCKGNYDEKVTINYYYNNAKVVVQGRPLLLFNEIITMFSELIDTDEIPKAFNDCYDLKVEKDSVIKQYEIKMPNSYDKHEPKLKKVLLQAVYNTNIKGDMFDYTYLISPALRALEGHIKYVYKYNSIIIAADETIGSIFYKVNRRFYLKEEYKKQLNDDNKVKYIEDVYNYYHKYRHKLFHWDNVDLPQDDTLIIENYGEAICRINDTLSIIDSYYKL